MAQDKPLPLNRNDLAKFLPDLRSIKAFEELFNLVPFEFNNLDDRVTELENPNTIEVGVDFQMGVDNYNIVVKADGLTLTLPKCATAIIGRQWTVHLAVAGTVTIVTNTTDTIPTTATATETTIILNRRGSTVDFLCNSDSTWSFV